MGAFREWGDSPSVWGAGRRADDAIVAFVCRPTDDVLEPAETFMIAAREDNCGTVMAARCW